MDTQLLELSLCLCSWRSSHLFALTRKIMWWSSTTAPNGPEDREFFHLYNLWCLWMKTQLNSNSNLTKATELFIHLHNYTKLKKGQIKWIEFLPLHIVFNVKWNKPNYQVGKHFIFQSRKQLKNKSLFTVVLSFFKNVIKKLKKPQRRELGVDMMSSW